MFTITLNRSVNANLVLSAGKTFTLKLNGNTLTGASDDAIANKGALTVEGPGAVRNNVSGKGALVNYPDAKATLNGGEFSATSWYTIKNMGDMTINQAAKVTTSSGSSSLIANGWYGNAGNDRNQPYPASGTTANLTINGGTFSGGMNTVKNDDCGSLKIVDGSFSNTTGPTLLNWHIAEIQGGDFSVPSGHVLANGYLEPGKDAGKLTVSGGTFTSGSGDQTAMLGYGDGTKHGGAVNINGGEFHGTITGITGSQVTVTQGTFSSVPATGTVASDATVAGVKGFYYIGGADRVAAKVANLLQSGDTVEVLQGNLVLTGVAGNVTVQNSGSGSVKVNGETVVKDKPVTTQTQHNHVYGPYESNEKGHWAECVGCGEKEAVQAHEYIGNGNICKICGYKRAAAAPQDGAKVLPKTGDDTPLAALYALLAAALGACVALGIRRRRSA
ncbi:MAG: LPXTG cell wall anchor domain-containing protein [Clostridiales bacterium]|nr:LPXTG cell wall anchor domain-containing protein [Clostridiales bacterium]